MKEPKRMSSSLHLVHQCLAVVLFVAAILFFQAQPTWALVDGQSRSSSLPLDHQGEPSSYFPADAAASMTLPKDGGGGNKCPINCSCAPNLSIGLNGTKMGMRIDCRNQHMTSMPKNMSGAVGELLLTANSIFVIQDELRGLTKLQTLSLSGNRLSILDELTFSDLSLLTFLDLSRNSLKSNIPLEVFEGLSSLRHLNVCSNHLAHLSNRLFDGLGDLRTLDLSSNVIAGIDRDAFKDLSALLLLDLSRNRIDSLEIEWFQSLQKLQTLRLNGNRLKGISNTVFWNLKGLQTLNLSRNAISAIGYLSFRGLNEVSDLDLSGNNFTHLQEGTFRPMEKLRELDLSDSPLMRFDGLFSSSGRLERLSMRNMYRLSSLSRDSFRGLSQVKQIRLVNSHLRNVHRYAFETLGQLTVLDLRANNLTSLPRNLFENLKMIESIHLEGNPWRCDCFLFWLLRWLGESHHQSHVLSPLDTVCRTPEKLLGIPILDALDHHMVCLNANVTKHSPESTFKLGASATLFCKPSGFPQPTLTWITPSNVIFHWVDVNRLQNATFEEPPPPSSGGGQKEPTTEAEHQSLLLQGFVDGENSEHRVVHRSEQNPIEDDQLSRFSLLRNGSLVVRQIQRGDSGVYRCVVSNALRNTTVTIPVKIDLQFRVEIQMISILVGMATSFGFLFLTILFVVIEMILDHFGVECPCMTTSSKAKQIRKMLESMETYKSQQLEWLKDNYTSQAQRIKDNCMQQMEKLRESYSSQVERLRDIRDYGTAQIDRIRDNYYNQVQRVRDYSTSQIDRLRENYVFQRNRIRKFSAHQFIKFRENYKVQQQHLNKILENLNLESCKSNCNRTESIIFEPELLAVDGVFQIPALEGLEAAARGGGAHRHHHHHHHHRPCRHFPAALAAPPGVAGVATGGAEIGPSSSSCYRHHNHHQEVQHRAAVLPAPPPDGLGPSPLLLRFRDDEAESQGSDYFYTPEDSGSLVSNINQYDDAGEASGGVWGGGARACMTTKRDIGVSTGDLAELQIVLVHKSRNLQRVESLPILPQPSKKQLPGEENKIQLLIAPPGGNSLKSSLPLSSTVVPLPVSQTAVNEETEEEEESTKLLSTEEKGTKRCPVLEDGGQDGPAGLNPALKQLLGEESNETRV